jgi:hypothetical protein
MAYRQIVLLLPLLALSIPSCGAQTVLPETPPPSEGKLEVREVRLGRMISSRDDIKVSRDQKRVAFKVKKGEKEVVVVDGREGQGYDTVRSGWFFSPDSRRIAYAARRDGLQFIIVDGVEGKGYEPWDDMYPIFSPDSKRIASMVRRSNGTMMVIDGVEGKPYRSLETQPPPHVFSPDSKRSIYAAESDKGRWVAVVDGIEGKAYDFVESVQFSPDSRRFLHEASRGGDSFVVVDGVEGPAFSRVSLFSDGGVHFSPDSKRVAYIAYPKPLKKFAKMMVVDGVAGKEYDDIEFVPQIFSPDSRHFGYVAKIGVKQCIVIDGHESPLFDRIGYLRFSSDGKHTAYSASRGNEVVTLCDGKEVAKAAGAFSPDWQHLVYIAPRGRGWTVVRDGKDGARHTVGETWRTQLFFSPDSQRLAYRASQAREIEFVVVDGIQSIRYQLVDVGNPIFSPDSKHFAYWAAPASGKWHVFVDKAYSDAYDEPVFGSKLVFDGPDTLHALAVRGSEMFRVEIEIAAPHNN